jgi:adenylylsulfate kinase
VQPRPAFAIWITGLPASGKSSITRALVQQLAVRNRDICVLESDALRPILTPYPRYDEAERDSFYNAMAYIGMLLTRHGVPVIFDATANLQAYRARARRLIANFIEVYVDCPLEICMQRDPKGIYRMGQSNAATTVPGLQAVYEAPDNPDILIDAVELDAQNAARKIVDALVQKSYLT